MLTPQERLAPELVDVDNRRENGEGLDNANTSRREERDSVTFQTNALHQCRAVV